jgi:glycosyltransferase involved in cell wall biosynthesis
VLISDQVNIYREIVAGGVGAAVPTQIEPLTRELARWMGDENQRKQAGSIAPAFVRAHYDADTVARHWIETYARLARSTTGAGGN